MPFTLSHAAAALPFRRTGLVMSALVMGCFAPDFEYFIPFAHHGAFGHTLPGFFVFDLPLCFVVLWVFHHYAKEPLAAFLPLSARRRFDLGPRSMEVDSVKSFVLVTVSILVGIATHMLWDSFTHGDYWLYDHWLFLREKVDLPLFGSRPWYGIFQYISSFFGLVIILFWFIHWYRSTSPKYSVPDPRVVSRDRKALASICAIAASVALIRAVSFGVPDGVRGSQRFMTTIAVTGLAVLWAEVVVYGFVRTHRRDVVDPA